MLRSADESADDTSEANFVHATCCSILERRCPARIPASRNTGRLFRRTRNSSGCIGIAAHAAKVVSESMPRNPAGGHDALVAAFGLSCLRRGKGVRGRSRVCDPPRALLCAESRRVGAACLRPDHEISHLPPPAQAHPPGPQAERTARHTDGGRGRADARPSVRARPAIEAYIDRMPIEFPTPLFNDAYELTPFVTLIVGVVLVANFIGAQVTGSRAHNYPNLGRARS